MKKKDRRVIHAVSHTHWDREWYFTTIDTQVLAVKAFTELVEALEGNEHFDYHLDAQSSLLVDYLQIKPEMTARVRKLVAAKRLLVGPWYTQPDLFAISTESMFRNLRIGIYHAKQAGYCMDVLYLPDTFGAHAQIPQLASAFGLNNILIRRGYDRDLMGPPELMWQAANGEQVKTVVMPYGYMLGHPERGARYRNFDINHFHVETFPLLERMKQLSDSEHLLCPIGGDQVSCDKDFEKLVAQVGCHSEDDWRVSNYEAFMAAIEPDSLSIYQGEFRSPRMARVHKSIGSSRYDIKKANYEAEACLITLVEPMIALARANGFRVPEEMLEKAWRLLLESHAHDSAGGCNSDETNRDVVHRCRQAQQIGEALYNLCARLLLQNHDRQNTYRFLLTNGTSSPRIYSRDQVLISASAAFSILDNEGASVPFVLLDQQKINRPRHVLLTPDGEVETLSDEFYYLNHIDIPDVAVPPMGMAQFRLESATADSMIPMRPLTQSAIENSRYKLTWRDGNLDLLDKFSGDTIERLIRLADIANDGDLYDFSPLAGDEERLFDQFEWLGASQCERKQELRLSATLQLPEAINSQRTERVSQQRPVAIELVVTMEDDVIRFALAVDNQVREHRMQVLINTGKAITSVKADMPFGWIERHNQNITSASGYTEMPVDTEPFMHWLSAHEDYHVYARGLKEYEYSGSDLRLTLFRGAGFVGKDDLLYRPGRASGHVLAAPEANLTGWLHFEFALSLGKRSAAAVVISQQKYSFNALLWQWQEEEKHLHRLDNFDMEITQKPVTVWSLIDEIPQGLVWSGTDVLYGKTLLRFCNPAAQPIDIPQSWKSLLCNALGEPINKDRLTAFDHLTLRLANTEAQSC